MEKRSTSERDLRELVKQADDEEAVFMINLTGFIKYASGRDKPGIVVIATGDRASKVREALKDLLE